MGSTPSVAQRPAEPILHADMDAFFASVEQRDDPDLRGKPVVVGGAGNRGVVAAASYEARRFGVHSAMPMVRARRLCRDLVIVPSRFDAYREASDAVMEIFRDHTPLVEPLSLDEAFLDVGGAVRLLGSPTQIATSIRTRIRQELDLPCSIGIGSTKFVAKLLSARAKPDGIAHWRKDEVLDRLRPLPIGALWGAGPKTVEKLERYGFRTIGQIADADRRTLERVVGEAVGSHLFRLATGQDLRTVTTHESARSVSAEQTWEEDVDDPEILDRRMLALAEKVGHRLRKSGLAARTVTIKVRFASFETITRSTTASTATDRTHDLVELSRELLHSLRLERAQVRLLGVSTSNLVEGSAARQLALDTDVRWEDVDKVADAVKAKFEGLGISYAALLDEDVRDAPTNDDHR